MWPFRKKTAPVPPPALTLEEALSQLQPMGIGLRADIEPAALLDEFSTGAEEPVDRLEVLCVLGGETELGKGGPASDDIWHLDAECIVEDGDYVRLAQRFMALAKGRLPLTGLRDHVDLGEKEAWFEFTLDGQTERWEIEVQDDWMDPAFYARFQQLLSRHSSHRFMICALGQDSLLLCGDEKLRQAVSEFSGHSFQWQ